MLLTLVPSMCCLLSIIELWYLAQSASSLCVLFIVAMQRKMIIKMEECNGCLCVGSPDRVGKTITKSQPISQPEREISGPQENNRIFQVMQNALMVQSQLFDFQIVDTVMRESFQLQEYKMENSYTVTVTTLANYCSYKHGEWLLLQQWELLLSQGNCTLTVTGMEFQKWQAWFGRCRLRTAVSTI